MKILHVITSLRTGGAEKLMVDLLPRLSKLGNTVELLVFDGIKTPFYEELEAKGIKIHAFDVKGNVYNPYYIFRLIPFTKKYDIVHAHNTAPQLFCAIAKLFGGKCRLFTTEHNTTNRRRSIPFFKYIDYWMYSQYEKIICISDKAKENLTNYVRGFTSKIVTIYNGIDLIRYQNAEADTKLKEQYKGKKLGIMVAGFREQKDQQTIIKAYKELPNEYHLLLAGTGVTENECKELTHKLDLENRVHFLGLRNDVPSLLKTADVIIMSSHYEGLSLSSIEGMACGNPFLASDVDGLKEVVENAGVLFPHEDAKKLAEEIQKLSSDLDYRNKIITLCQERAKGYDISSMALNYNEQYKITYHV